MVKRGRRVGEVGPGTDNCQQQQQQLFPHLLSCEVSSPPSTLLRRKNRQISVSGEERREGKTQKEGWKDGPARRKRPEVLVRPAAGPAVKILSEILQMKVGRFVFSTSLRGQCLLSAEGCCPLIAVTKVSPQTQWPSAAGSLTHWPTATPTHLVNLPPVQASHHNRETERGGTPPPPISLESSS